MLGFVDFVGLFVRVDEQLEGCDPNRGEEVLVADSDFVNFDGCHWPYNTRGISSFEILSSAVHSGAFIAGSDEQTDNCRANRQRSDERTSSLVCY